MRLSFLVVWSKYKDCDVVGTLYGDDEIVWRFSYQIMIISFLMIIFHNVWVTQKFARRFLEIYLARVRIKRKEKKIDVFGRSEL